MWPDLAMMNLAKSDVVFDVGAGCFAQVTPAAPSTAKLAKSEPRIGVANPAEGPQTAPSTENVNAIRHFCAFIASPLVTVERHPTEIGCSTLAPGSRCTLSHIGKNSSAPSDIAIENPTTLPFGE
jgi:hypothetical protein